MSFFFGQAQKCVVFLGRSTKMCLQTPTINSRITETEARPNTPKIKPNKQKYWQPSSIAHQPQSSGPVSITIPPTSPAHTLLLVLCNCTTPPTKRSQRSWLENEQFDTRSNINWLSFRIPIGRPSLCFRPNILFVFWIMYISHKNLNAQQFEFVPLIHYY